MNYFSNDCVFLDTETTGLDHKDQIVEISIVSGTGQILMDQLVQPIVPMKKEAFDVNGITPAMLEGAPTWIEIAGDVQGILENKVVVAWFADFDKRMVAQTSKAFSLGEPLWEWVCGKRFYSQYVNEFDYIKERLKRYKLVEAAQKESIDLTGVEGLNPHRSLFDASLMQQILLKTGFYQINSDSKTGSF